MKQGASHRGVDSIVRDRGLSCQNRRKSELRRLQNRFFAIFASRNATLRSKIANLYRLVLRYPGAVPSVMSMVFRLALAVTTDQKSTECDTKSTERDTKSTEYDIPTTLGDTFTTLRARRKSRLTSDRLRLFDFWVSCGFAPNLNCGRPKRIADLFHAMLVVRLGGRAPVRIGRKRNNFVEDTSYAVGGFWYCARHCDGLLSSA